MPRHYITHRICAPPLYDTPHLCPAIIRHFASVPRDYLTRNGVPRHYVTRNGVPRHYLTRNGVPRHYLTRNGVPRHYLTRNGVSVDARFDGSHFDAVDANCVLEV